MNEAEGKPLFIEYLPLFAHRIPPANWPVRLEAWARHASVDCNGGLFVGMALFGPTERARFEAMLDDPDLEAYGGTGTEYAAWLGFRRLGLRLTERFAALRAATAGDARNAAHAAHVLLALLEVHCRCHPHQMELAGVADDGDAFWGLQRLEQPSGSHVDDSLPGLIERVLPERAQHARELLERIGLLARWEAALGSPLGVR